MTLEVAAGAGGFGDWDVATGDTLYCCLPLYHNNALTVAVLRDQRRRDAGAGQPFSASRFWDEVIATRDRVHLHR